MWTWFVLLLSLFVRPLQNVGNERIANVALLCTLRAAFFQMLSVLVAFGNATAPLLWSHGFQRLEKKKFALFEDLIEKRLKNMCSKFVAKAFLLKCPHALPTYKHNEYA